MGEPLPFRHRPWQGTRGLRALHSQRGRRSGFGAVSRHSGFLALAALVGAALLYQQGFLPGGLNRMSPREETFRLANPPIIVLDGDTVRFDGKTYRLVGIDTPEKNPRAQCSGEHDRAMRASRRLQQLVDGGDTELARVACACRQGTEGTSACNHGRLCGKLTAGGRDVARILINEGLAHPYPCGGSGCPPRRNWCA
jgi:endonuclease YncB( thermonuclease family)